MGTASIHGDNIDSHTKCETNVEVSFKISANESFMCNDWW